MLVEKYFDAKTFAVVAAHARPPDPRATIKIVFHHDGGSADAKVEARCEVHVDLESDGKDTREALRALQRKYDAQRGRTRDALLPKIDWNAVVAGLADVPGMHGTDADR